jgi:hypothetical protein
MKITLTLNKQKFKNIKNLLKRNIYYAYLAFWRNDLFFFVLFLEGWEAVVGFEFRAQAGLKTGHGPASAFLVLG